MQNSLQGKKNTKSTLSGEDGDFEISKFRAGKSRLIISASGFESQTIPVTILRGKILEFRISLQAQVVKLSATAYSLSKGVNKVRTCAEPYSVSFSHSMS